MSNYTSKLKNLKNQMSKYATFEPEKRENKINLPISMSLIKKNLIYIFYIMVPIIIFIILFRCKPPFVLEETINIDNNVEKKRNLGKIFQLSLIFGFIIDIGIYIFLYKKNNNNK